MKYQLYLLTISILLLTISQFITAQSCSCTEYVYLNETTNGGSVHKYSVSSDGTLTEVGNPWYGGTALPKPHGLGTDLNGFLYIAETIDESPSTHIRRLDCDGNLYPESNFAINLNTPNIATYNNFLVANDWDEDGLPVYDICSGNLLNTICLTDAFPNFVGTDWGLSYSPHTGLFYATDGFSHNKTKLYVFSPADLLSTTCIDPIYSGNSNRFGGVTADQDGNIYVVENQNSFGGGPGRVIKFDANGNILATSVFDTVDGDGGYYKATGIVYSETCNCLYVSTQSPFDDCVTRFNLDLTQSFTAVPATGTGSDNAKGITILNECCPVPNNLVIDTLFCNVSYPVDISLQDLIMCEGIICGGDWMPDPSNIGIDFEVCDNSITLNEDQACGTFTLSSDGSSPNAQCGAFTVTINIETTTIVAATISGDQTICTGDTPTVLTANSPTANVTYQWQESTTGCSGFTDIVGATSDTYTPSALSTTTYYRVVTAAMGGCATGNCTEFSNCATVTVNPAPALTTEAPVCMTDGSNTYSVAFTSDVTVTASTGTVSGSSVTGIVAGTDVTLTATLGDCTTEAIVSSPVCSSPDLRLGKTVDIATASLGQIVTFTLVVYNEGTEELTNVEVTDVLPTGLTYTGDDSGGSYDSGTGIWAIPSIVIGDSAVIEIMATMDVEGVVVNSAEITAADQLEGDSDLTDNKDNACVSVPIQLCDNEAISIDLEADAGYTNYQWYKDGVLITGATNQIYTATEVGNYIYTVDGVGPGDCVGELCCPIVIEQVSCCPPIQCIPITMKKLE